MMIELPALPHAEWQSTQDTLHLYCQIAGKVKLGAAPKVNHWWHVALLPTVRGLTTGPIPHRLGSFELAFDFIDHELGFTSSEGARTSLALRDGLAVNAVHAWVLDVLTNHGIGMHEVAWIPYQGPSKIPFATDSVHAHYDARMVHDFHRILVFVTGALERYRGRFTGKSTPPHFFWRSFDLAVTRFSGKTAPVRSGSDRIQREAHSHELISCGFAGGDHATPAPRFYVYAHPEGAGLTGQPLAPAAAEWVRHDGLHLATLSYEAMRRSSDPARTLLDFLESAYLACARTGGWTIEALRAPWAA